MDEPKQQTLKVIEEAATAAMKAGHALSEEVLSAFHTVAQDLSLDAIAQALVRMELKTLGFEV